MGWSRLCVFADESTDVFQTIRLTQGEDHFSRLAGSQRDFCRDCRAGIKAWTGGAGQPKTRQSGGPRNRAVFSKKLRAISGDRVDWRTTGREGDLLREITDPRIPRQYRAALWIAFTDDLTWSVFTDRPKNPFGVVRCRQTPWPIAIITYCQAHQLNRIVGCDENPKVLIQTVIVMCVTSIPLTVANRYLRCWSQRQWRGCP